MFSPKKFVDVSCLICLIALCMGGAICADGGAQQLNSTFPETGPSEANSTSTPVHLPSQNASNSSSHPENANPPKALANNSSLSEATDMTSSQKYTGGSDVDEVRPTVPSRPRKRPHSPPMHAEITASEDDGLLKDLSQPTREKLRTDRFNPTFAAIVAAICITTAVGGYVLLMAWQRVEMDRYGNRQMLVNEDDFGDIQDEDMRHFEASCIQID